MGWVGCGGGAEVGKDLGVGTRTGKDGLCYERQEGKTWTVISHSWPSWQFKPVHSLVGGLFSAFQYALKIHCWMLSSIPGHCSLDTRETHSPNSDNQNVSTMPNIGGIKFTPRWGSFSSVLFSLVAQLCTTLCDPRDYSTPGLPVHHQLPELTQTHVHWVSDAIQPSYPLSSLLLLPSIFPSIRVFSNESTLHIRWPKYQSFNFRISPSNEYPGLISFRMDWLDLLAVQESQESSPTPQFKSINSLALSFLHIPTLTSIHDYWKNHSFL